MIVIWRIGVKSNRSSLIILISIVWAVPLSAAVYERRDTWGDTVWAVREAAQAYHQRSTFKAFRSDVLQAGQAPQKVVLPLHGIRKLIVANR